MVNGTLSIVISSALASTIATFVGNPLEVVKIRQQTDLIVKCTANHKNQYSFIFKEQLKFISKFLTRVQCLRNQQSLTRYFIQLYAKEGFPVFFKGSKVAIQQSLISNIAYLLFYEQIKKVASEKIINPVALPLVSSSLARLLTTTSKQIFKLWLVTYPLEYIRVNQSWGNKISFPLFKSTGFLITLQRDIAYSSILWVLLENLKQKFKESYPNNENYVNMLSGMIAGGITSAITLPIDVIKTQRQTIGKQGSIYIFKNILEKDGLSGLFKGFKPRILKATIQSTIFFSLYEESKSLLKKY